MGILNDQQRDLAEAVHGLVYSNPFLATRISHEREALGGNFSEPDADWNLHPDRQTPNLSLIQQRADMLADHMATKLADGDKPAGRERELYQAVILWVLYHRYRMLFEELIAQSSAEDGAPPKVSFYAHFAADARHFLSVLGQEAAGDSHIAHLFACFFQVRRAFTEIFKHIIGLSKPAATLRAQVWQSIFTHDLNRYRKSLYQHMGDFTTLITGPSGTGKELVARAIGLSRYIGFDPSRRAFEADFAGSFHALNLTALSPTLIESELFGHRKGAFTGAISDNVGWLETCPPHGTVFLDEIGDLDPAIQIKLLRVLQTRAFSRIGATTVRQFKGKVIAATNRDVAAQMAAGRFREDFYYRLCSDIITTPSLYQRIADHPDELHHMVCYIARRLVGDDAEPIAGQVESWIDANLGRQYPWPGNVRELEQCVRNVLIRNHYTPRRAETPTDAGDELVRALTEGRMTADELLSRYCTVVYARTRNYVETARRLGLDRRTIKSHIDEELLADLDAAHPV